MRQQIGGARAAGLRAALRLACALGLTAVAWGCERSRESATARDAPPCDDAVEVGALPAVLHETSGLAASRRYAGVLWTHNDSGGEPVVYALDTRGRLLGAVRVSGARNVDWEDIALGPCAAGDCLYIADTGDNDAARASVDIYRVPEPAPGEQKSAPAERLTVTYPDGPRDAEALFVLPDEGIYIVSKGRKSPVAVYRVPSAAAPGASLPLIRLQVLSPNGSEDYGLVTGADATPDGRWVAIRTYESLTFYHPQPGGGLQSAYARPARLESAREPQGEAVAFGRGDTIWLSSETGYLGDHPHLARIECALGGAGGRSASGPALPRGPRR